VTARTALELEVSSIRTSEPNNRLVVVECSLFYNTYI